MGDKKFTHLVKSMQIKLIQYPIIQYTVVDNMPYVVGSNRLLAAKQLGIVDQIKFQKVDFPVNGTNFNTVKDVLDTVGLIKPPKYRGNN